MRRWLARCSLFSVLWLLLLSRLQGQEAATLLAAWRAPDGRVELRLSVPAGAELTQAALLAGDAATPLQIEPAAAAPRWLLLDAGETLLALYPAVGAAVERWLEAGAAPAGLVLVDGQPRSLNVTAEPAAWRDFLATYSAGVGQPACFADALTPLSLPPAGTLWRVLVIAGAHNTLPGCAVARLPAFPFPVDVLLVGATADPALIQLAEASGGRVLRADLRRLEPALNELQQRWQQPLVTLRGQVDSS
ncbi:MAG: hypothetical protein MUE40_07930, partial [Anaerolineae bacterium]|nr:hypothetical protein [Anaerolineae bacterium]